MRVAAIAVDIMGQLRYGKIVHYQQRLEDINIVSNSIFHKREKSSIKKAQR